MDERKQKLLEEIERNEAGLTPRQVEVAKLYAGLNRKGKRRMKALAEKARKKELREESGKARKR